MMAGRRTPLWLLFGALAMLLAFLWFLFAGFLPPQVWAAAVGLAVVAALLLLGRGLFGRRRGPRPPVPPA